MTTEESVKELGELAQTAGAQVVGSVIQNREKIHPGTYIGKGKLDEVRMMLWETDATGIICDDELSPAQLNNLQSELDCKVCDRTLLILDIFARHAVTSEGKLQVELAQLRYRAARLRGLEIPVQTWRRNRNERSWREKAGDGPPSDPHPHQPSEAGTGGSDPPQRADPCRTEKVRAEDCGARRLYLSWQIRDF